MNAGNHRRADRGRYRRRDSGSNSGRRAGRCRGGDGGSCTGRGRGTDGESAFAGAFACRGRLLSIGSTRQHGDISWDLALLLGQHQQQQWQQSKDSSQGMDHRIGRGLDCGRSKGRHEKHRVCECQVISLIVWQLAGGCWRSKKIRRKLKTELPAHPLTRSDAFAFRNAASSQSGNAWAH